MPYIKMFPVPIDGVRPRDVYPVSEDFKGIAFRGTGDINYICGHCESILFADMKAGQIDGAGVMQCPQCRGYNKFPIRGAVAHPADPFESAKLSIKWAKEHINDFEKGLQLFVNSHPYTLSVDFDSNTGEYVENLRLVKSPSDQFRKTARDAIQGLRAALDHAMFAIVRKEKYFPIGNSPANFEERLRNGKPRLPEEIHDVLREFKPYKGGNDLFWALNQLCNPNKHGLIRHVGTVVGQIAIERANNRIQLIEWDSTKNQMEIGRHIPDTNYRTPNLNIAFDITIHGVELIEGKPALAVLCDFAHEVEGIVVALEAVAIRIGAV